MGDVHMEAKLYQNVATTYNEMYMWRESLAAGIECVRRLSALGDIRILLYALWNMAETCSNLDRPVEAAQLMAFSHRWWTDRFGPLPQSDTESLEEFVSRVKQMLGNDKFQKHWLTGERMTLPQATSLVFTLEDV